MPAANRPINGVATAPASIEAVSVHCAAPRDTPSSAAMVGTSGAPRLLTTPVTVVSRIRVGINSRAGGLSAAVIA